MRKTGSKGSKREGSKAPDVADLTTVEGAAARFGLNDKEQEVLRKRLLKDPGPQVPKVIYNHKTVSVLPEARDLLGQVQQLIVDRGVNEVRGLLNSDHQAALDELLANKKTTTMGIAFWISCAMAMERLAE